MRGARRNYRTAKMNCSMGEEGPRQLKMGMHQPDPIPPHHRKRWVHHKAQEEMSRDIFYKSRYY